MNSGRTAVTQSHSVHGGALSFMSCTSGRESSPLDESDSHQTGDFKTETKKKRFHPLRNLRRMFRRKTRHSNVSNDSYHIGSPDNSTEISTTPLEQRSCSTSKLVEENGMQNLMKNNRLAPGLSLSHDSVFTPDRADSGLSSSDLENSSLSISNFVPPPVEYPLKSHSSCSESSLLSMDSSEGELSPTAIKSDLDLGITSFKLSHSAAKHKMAVKPKRNHGAPRSRRRAMNSKSPLPSTPEVNEEVMTGKGVSSTDLFGDSLEIPPSTSKPSSPLSSELSQKQSIDSLSVKPSSVSSKSSESDSALSLKASRPKPEDERDAAEETKTSDECGDVNEEDWADKTEEETTPRKEESFFGRLLSRRSEKKKKHNTGDKNGAAKDEQTGEETAKTKESPAKESFKTSATSGRSVNRRQRVEPIEIPSSPSLAKKSEYDVAGRNVRDNSGRMKISYSMSPPKTVSPNPLISRSSSPPKVVWPEHFSCYKAREGSRSSFDGRNLFGDASTSLFRASVHEDTFGGMRRDLSPPAAVAKTKETQKILADEVESKFKLRSSKCLELDESPKSLGSEMDVDSRSRREHPWEEVHSVNKLVDTSFMKESDRSKPDDGLSSKANDAFSSADVVITHEEPHYVNLKNILPVLSSYEKVHHGYENVQVIELVKKEKESSKSQAEEEKLSSTKVKDGDDADRKTSKLEKVKSMRRDSPPDVTPEFMKVQLNRVEPRAEEPKSETEKTGSSPPPRVVRSTLIERRKSELMLTTEVDAEKDKKPKVKLLKKQTSFSEAPTKREKSPQEEKTEIVAEEVAEVVMRKKATSAGRGGDDQPELMKVFARRSLKVRESEEIAEEMRRSRDSDKENENGESPKEERKKMAKASEEERKQKEAGENAESEVVAKTKTPDEVMIQVTPLKPEVASRKAVFQKFGKTTASTVGNGCQMENGVSSAENKGKTRKEQSVLEETKSNKMKSGSDLVSVSCIKEANAVAGDEESEEIGFKRIQQRKAEWERRVQQAAK